MKRYYTMNKLDEAKRIAGEYLNLPLKEVSEHPVITKENTYEQCLDLISRAESLEDVFKIIKPAYQRHFIRDLLAVQETTYEECGNLLAIYWPNLTSTYHDGVLPFNSYQTLVANASAGVFMNDEEKFFYDALPQSVKVYRGAKISDKAGICWTLDEHIAKLYAKLVNGKVFTGIIDKKYVYAYLKPDSTLLLYGNHVKFI